MQACRPGAEHCQSLDWRGFVAQPQDLQAFVHGSPPFASPFVACSPARRLLLAQMALDSDSDSPLSRAVEACRPEVRPAAPCVVAPDGAGDPAPESDAALDAVPCVAAPDAAGGVARPRRLWRRVQKTRAVRQKETLHGAVNAIHGRLGRVGASASTKASAIALGQRKAKAGSLTPELLLELSFGANCDQALLKTLPRALTSATSCGLSLRTARRARSLVLDAIHNSTEAVLTDRAQQAFHGVKPIARGYKFSWDEMALRFWVSQESYIIECNDTV